MRPTAGSPVAGRARQALGCVVTSRGSARDHDCGATPTAASRPAYAREGRAGACLPFLLLLYVVAWLDRVNIGFAALQMNADLGFSDTVYGFGAGIFFIGYALFEVPSNLILARVGARLWIARIMITWGILVGRDDVRGGADRASTCCASCSASRRPASCPASSTTSAIGIPRRSARARCRGSCSRFRSSTVVGGPLAGFILELDGWHGLTGWQWLFLLEGMPAVVLGFVVLVLSDGLARQGRVARRPRSAAGSPSACASEQRAAQRATASASAPRSCIRPCGCSA